MWIFLAILMLLITYSSGITYALPYKSKVKRVLVALSIIAPNTLFLIIGFTDNNMFAASLYMLICWGVWTFYMTECAEKP